LHEYYKSLKRAGFPESVVLFMITEPQAYPAWILPTPIDPEKFGDYEDDDEDE
jgi:glycosylphosphatidylinositol transamidase (GPIT) subunit GPI8